PSPPVSAGSAAPASSRSSSKPSRSSSAGSNAPDTSLPSSSSSSLPSSRFAGPASLPMSASTLSVSRAPSGESPPGGGRPPSAAPGCCCCRHSSPTRNGALGDSCLCVDTSDTFPGEVTDLPVISGSVDGVIGVPLSPAVALGPGDLGAAAGKPA
ncbi:unnamed protein product, partial [Ectocarpus sp. 12 AP-2014]